MGTSRKTTIAAVLALTLAGSSALAEGPEAKMRENQVRQAMVSTQGSLSGEAANSSGGVLFPLILLTIVVFAAATASGGDPYAVVVD
ncbi:MAG: hypothetical protein R3D85_11455 [Paracoccaceae bacterium]